jgi:lysophospholipid acyltransferase (LPLAT)-like uncharacterized protein
MKSTKHSPLRWYDPILLRLLPPLATVIIWVMTRSCRIVKVEGEEKELEALARSRGRAVYATWHQRALFHARYFAGRDLTVMASLSRDGEYGVHLIKWLGHKAVRGSSTRGGYQALRELTEKIMQDARGGMLADGPVGPARVAKIGSVVMARNAEVPLLPVVWGADRCWVLNSWDRFLIPKPFARIVFCHAEPIWIPRSAQGESLETYRSLFEERLNQATRWCDEHFGSERPWRKVREKGMIEVGPL